MKVIGVIAEYNPFHLGHLYQINKIKEIYPDSLVIAIISSCFTQRGEVSIINKWDKARICLENNIDLVIELPTLYATQADDMFAYGALKILNELKIDTLVFGSECNDINMLIKLANIQLNNVDYDELVKRYLDEGINYPSAMAKALNDITNIRINMPNDLLALSYIKEIIKNNYNITPISIKRTNDYHGKSIDNNIINASLIIELLNNGKDISDYVPNITLKYIYKNVNYDAIYKFLLYNIINNKNCLSDYLTVDEGIESKIIRSINNALNLNDLIMKIKSKRYTYNKINRMLLHIMLNIKKSDNNKDIYVKVLGFNSNGRKHLNTIKKDNKSLFLYGYKPNISNVLDIELRSTYIYSLIVNDMSLIEREFKNKPIIK